MLCTSLNGKQDLSHRPVEPLVRRSYQLPGSVPGGQRRRGMASTGMQILAFILALLGVLGATVATLLPNWKVSADVGSNIITAISQMQGLWMDCTWYSTGMFSCTLKYSVLSLPAYLQTARSAMVLSCVLATLGLCLASLGLKCARWGGGQRSKGRAALASGSCFVMAGVLCLVPASWFTNEVITSFLDSNVPESNKFEPGGAVYVAFVSAGLLLVAGLIFCASCPGKRDGAQDLSISPADKPLQQQLHQQQLIQQHQHQQQLQQQLHQKLPHQGELRQEQQQCCPPTPTHPQEGRAEYSLQDYV
ncbi:claudin-20 [Arapaima gigas]